MSFGSIAIVCLAILRHSGVISINLGIEYCTGGVDHHCFKIS